MAVIRRVKAMPMEANEFDLSEISLLNIICKFNYFTKLF